MKAINSFRFVMASALCLAAISACNQEVSPVSPVSPDPEMETIKAVVGGVNQSTKAPALSCEEFTQSIPMSEEGLVLEEYVSDNLSQPLIGECPETKGTLVTTDNIKTFGKFGMEGFLDNYGEVNPAELTKFNVSLSNTDQYINGGVVDYTNGDWVLTNGRGNQYPWLHGMQYTFWSYFPYDKLGAYSYASVGSRSTMSVTGYTTPATAADQKDFLVAYNNRTYNAGDSKSIDINFRHALAEIYFDVTAITDAGYTVEGIEIDGAYGQGECSITGTDLADSDVTKAFVWTPKGSTAKFTMAGGADHFFMIPQKLEGAALKITLKKDGVTFSPSTLSMKTTWRAGKYYKYVLTYTEKLDIEVEENCNDSVKTDVSVKNTGNCPVYIRAAVVANWFNEDGDIVSAWDMTQGTFEGFPGTDWEAGDDGFYYYKKVVQAGENTENLFGSYTKPTAEGMHLEMKVMAQGIKYVSTDTYVSAWPY